MVLSRVVNIRPLPLCLEPGEGSMAVEANVQAVPIWKVLFFQWPAQGLRSMENPKFFLGGLLVAGAFANFWCLYSNRRPY